MTTGEVALVFRVCTATVIDWANKGLLKCWRVPGRGAHRRFEPKDVLAFARSQGIEMESVAKLRKEVEDA